MLQPFSISKVLPNFNTGSVFFSNPINSLPTWPFALFLPAISVDVSSLSLALSRGARSSWGFLSVSEDVDERKNVIRYESSVGL